MKVNSVYLKNILLYVCVYQQYICVVYNVLSIPNSRRVCAYGIQSLRQARAHCLLDKVNQLPDTFPGYKMSVLFVCVCMCFVCAKCSILALARLHAH